MRLVDPEGGQIGIKSIEEARWLADQLALDLVEVAPDSRPPVVRLMDYGKYKYEQSVRAREARKKQTRTVVKEVQFRPKIGSSDFDVKRKRVERFLSEGDKVKVTMRFRGREVTHPELGRTILERLAENVEQIGQVEVAPRLEGRQMTMVLAPDRRALAALAAGEDDDEAQATAPDGTQAEDLQDPEPTSTGEDLSETTSEDSGTAEPMAEAAAADQPPADDEPTEPPAAQEPEAEQPAAEQPEAEQPAEA